MTKRTQHDELHDKYQPDFEGEKRGTRYERLAALTFKSLEAVGAVRHDRKLTGDSGVVHQIDVLIDPDEQGRQLIVECKELGKDNVGLSIVRDLKGVMVDTGEESAIVLTTVGFTPEARKYAEYHGIVLGLMRAIPEGHLDQVFGDIGVYLAMPQAGISFAIDDARQRYAEIVAALAATGVARPEAEIYVRNGEERITMSELVQRLMEEHDADVRRNGAKRIAIGDWTVDAGADQLPLGEVEFSYKVDWDKSAEVDQLTFASEVAELILEVLGKRVIGWESDLRRRISDDTGEVQ